MKNQMREIVLAVFLSFVVVVSGVFCTQSKEVQASATTTTDSRVYREVEKSVFEEYIKDRVAPTIDNYLFAGWIARRSDGTGVAIESASDDVLSEDGVTITAKFVPAHLAGVACQVKANTYDEGVTGTELRVVSVVDGGTYKTFGYNLYKRILKSGTTNEYVETKLCGYDETNSVKNISETTDRYTGLYVYKDSTLAEKEVKTPADIFGAEAEGFYFTTVRIGTIPSSVYDSCILVIRPYWITADGTYVEGMAEFDRVADGKNEIVNISVNIKEAEQIAAGMLSVQYETTKFEFVGADCGRVFEEMETNVRNGTVQCVGIVSDIAQDAKNPNDVYVNLRFRKLNQELSAGGSVFAITKTEFCDSNEEFVSAKVWNVKF